MTENSSTEKSITTATTSAKVRYGAITFDCADPAEQARFYSSVRDLPVSYSSDDFVALGHAGQLHGRLSDHRSPAEHRIPRRPVDDHEGTPRTRERAGDRPVNVAIGLREFPGCEICLINQNQTSPDIVYVVEVWADEASANAAREAARAATSTGVSTTDVLAMLIDEPQRIDLVPLGGVGLADAG